MNPFRQLADNVQRELHKGKRHDFLELLRVLTDDTAWEEVDDMDTDDGHDYFFCGEDESEAFIRVDVDRVKVVVDDATVYEGRLSDSIVKACVRERMRDEG